VRSAGRRWRLDVSIAWLVVLSILVTACATRNLPPIGTAAQPFRPEADERALWARAEKEEERLLERAISYDDPLLQDYLRRVADRLVPEGLRVAGGPGLRIRVLRDPTLNAFAMPNGRIFVHTGLLSRLDNEAQLATILGHEITHMSHRHALTLHRDGREEQVAYTGVGVLSQTAGAVLGLGLPLTAVASIHGYGRALERDADRGGMDALVRAGYDPGEASRAFEALRQDSRDRGPLETFYFGSPPRLRERIRTTRKLARAAYARAAADPPPVKDTEEFQMRMRSVVRDNAYEDIRAGRFPLAQRQLDRVLDATPRDPVAHLYYGDLHRLHAQRARSVADRNDKAGKALARYERALELDPALAEPHRQLALLYYQQKDVTQARAAFEKYLALRPDASDAARIKGYLLELDR
jgi:beta-barrel assembly-enhancing protease